MKPLMPLLLIAAMSSGCAALGVIPPDVTLVDLEFTDLTMFETTGEFTVRNSGSSSVSVSGEWDSSPVNSPLVATTGSFQLNF